MLLRVSCRCPSNTLAAVTKKRQPLRLWTAIQKLPRSCGDGMPPDEVPSAGKSNHTPNHGRHNNHRQLQRMHCQYTKQLRENPFDTGGAASSADHAPRDPRHPSKVAADSDQAINRVKGDLRKACSWMEINLDPQKPRRVDGRALARNDSHEPRRPTNPGRPHYNAIWRARLRDTPKYLTWDTATIDPERLRQLELMWDSAWSLVPTKMREESAYGVSLRHQLRRERNNRPVHEHCC